MHQSQETRVTKLSPSTITLLVSPGRPLFVNVQEMRFISKPSFPRAWLHNVPQIHLTYTDPVLQNNNNNNNKMEVSNYTRFAWAVEKKTVLARAMWNEGSGAQHTSVTGSDKTGYLTRMC